VARVQLFAVVVLHRFLWWASGVVGAWADRLYTADFAVAARERALREVS